MVRGGLPTIPSTVELTSSPSCSLSAPLGESSSLFCGCHSLDGHGPLVHPVCQCPHAMSFWSLWISLSLVFTCFSASFVIRVKAIVSPLQTTLMECYGHWSFLFIIDLNNLGPIAMLMCSSWKVKFWQNHLSPCFLQWLGTNGSDKLVNSILYYRVKQIMAMAL